MRCSQTRVSLGKTSTTLASFTVLKEAGAARGLLVVAPLRPVYKVWPVEVAKWKDFENLRVEILHGPKKGEALRRPADIYCINYEGLQWLEAELAKLKKEKREIPFDVLVLDESHKIKNTKTVRYKTLRGIRHLFNRCWILTGTPASNSIENLFGQIYMLDGGARLGKFITHFRRLYFNEYPQRGGYSLWEPRRGAEDEIKAKIRDIAMYLSAEDHLTMPKLIENIIKVDLPAGTRKVYEELEDEFIAELNSGVVTAANAGAKSMKLRQIVGGGVYGSNGAQVLDDAKVEALLDLIEEQEGQPLMVAVGFQHEVARIRKALGYDAPYLGSGLSNNEANQIVDDWNAGKIPVLLVHPTTSSLGLNLQAGGNAMVWFTLTWSHDEYVQTIARIWRQGQEKPCVIHHLIAVDTIDERVLEVLRSKDAKQRDLLASLKQEIEK